MEHKDIKAYRKKKEISYTPFIEKVRRETKFIEKKISTTFGEIRVMIYYPNKEISEKKPVYFNFHGGGFVLGFYEQDGFLCQKIAQDSDCIVINIDYLLAPEYPFPLPTISSAEVIEKCLKNEKWLDSDNVFTGGFSAGGNLAVSVTLYLQQKYSITLSGVASIYAPLDFSIEETKRSSPKPEFAIAPERMKEYKEWYLPRGQDYNNTLVSPIYGITKDFPPIFIAAAAYDSLCEEELALVSKISDIGGKVTYEVFPECTHGFTHEIFNYHKQNTAKLLEQLKFFIQNYSYRKGSV